MRKKVESWGKFFARIEKLWYNFIIILLNNNKIMWAKESMPYNTPECEIPKNERESENNCFTDKHIKVWKLEFPNFAQLKGGKNEDENIQSFLTTYNDASTRNALLNLQSKEEMLNSPFGLKITEIPNDFPYKEATIDLAWETIVNIQREYDKEVLTKKEVYWLLWKFTEKRNKLKAKIDKRISEKNTKN